jgi:hypothetical protein
VRLLGTIVRLQYQRDHLKVPDGAIKRYDPINIVSVEELRITPDGIEAGPVDAPWLDVHHREHHHSRYRGDNGISVGFTGHYRMIRERYGDRISDGIAGENIIIDVADRVFVDELASGLCVITADGPVIIDHVVVAAPCVEFSRYALDFPRDAKPDLSVTETLRFLHQGMRGYYARTGESATLRLGDEVSILP